MSVVTIPKTIPMSHPSPPEQPPPEQWTITCYICGMPSSSVWAKPVRCNPPKSDCDSEPYYPFLKGHNCPNGAVLKEDGTTSLCAFCFVSLEAQWNDYENSTDEVHPDERKYNLQKFICAVCGVQTYRKRIRALPFQEFPFLLKERQSGSLTLGQNPLAIVCLDCSETLWAQSAEYDRWGLPVHKRHFNWMARPPPPENSMEATVARLPSGETQLPRCPPVEPSVTAEGKIVHAPTFQPLQAIQFDLRSTKNEGSKKKSGSNSNGVTASRKISASSLDVSQFPPVVTVAPMSSHKNVMSIRKGSTTIPPTSTPEGLERSRLDRDAAANGLLSQALAAPYVPKNSGILIEPPYSGFQYHPREISYSYNALDAMNSSNVSSNPWPWIPGSPSTDLLNYQTYLSSLAASRRYTVPESYLSPTHSIYSAPPPQSNCQAMGLSTSPYAQVSTSFHSRHHHPVQERLPSHYGQNTSMSYSSETQAVALDCCTPSTKGGHTVRCAAVGIDNQNQKTQAVTRGHDTHVLKKQPSVSVLSSDKNMEMNQTIYKPNFQGSTTLSRTRKTSAVLGSPESTSTTKHTAAPSHFTSSARRPGQTTSPSYSKLAGDKCTDSSFGSSDVVDLTKKTENTKPKANTGRPRSSSFSIAFLCNESNSPTNLKDVSHSVPQKNSSRSSVIVTLNHNNSAADLVLDSREKNGQPSASTLSNPTLAQEKQELIRPESIAKSSEVNSTKSTLKRNIEIKLPPKKAKIDLHAISSEYDSKVIEIDEEKEVEVIDLIKMNEDQEKQFVEKTLQEFKQKEAKRKGILRAEEKTKQDFLKTFELVSPKQLSEMELRKTLSRAKKKTLPPLKLRPASPKENSREEGTRLQKEASFALSKYGENNGYVLSLEQQAFFQHLGLKLNSPKEKLLRDQQWCLMVAEKILRRLRHNYANVCTNRKRTLEDSSNLTNALVPLAKICRIDTFSSRRGIELTKNLSIVLSTDNWTKPWLIDSSDLLSIANPGNSTEQSPTDGSNIGAGPIITYPKYTPRYVTAGSEKNTYRDESKHGAAETPSNSNILNVPSVDRHSIPTLERKSSGKSVSVWIPKVPVLNSSASKMSRVQSANCEDQLPDSRPCNNSLGQKVNNNHKISECTSLNHCFESESRLSQVNTNMKSVSINNEAGEAGSPKMKASTMEVVDRFNDFWKRIQRDIDNLLSSTTYFKESTNDSNVIVVSELKKLREALITGQAEMKAAERKLKAQEQLLNPKSQSPIVNGAIAKNTLNTKSSVRKNSEQTKGI